VRELTCRHRGVSLIPARRRSTPQLLGCYARTSRCTAPPRIEGVAGLTLATVSAPPASRSPTLVHAVTDGGRVRCNARAGIHHVADRRWNLAGVPGDKDDMQRAVARAGRPGLSQGLDVRRHSGREEMRTSAQQWILACAYQDLPSSGCSNRWTRRSRDKRRGPHVVALLSIGINAHRLLRSRRLVDRLRADCPYSW
jgi:hypothetical protein